ncbi:MAG TPA: radical SAM protein [bacterium]|jgi:organic radical activating enzyme|nr:radical SAM protein [bacterium]
MSAPRAAKKPLIPGLRGALRVTEHYGCFEGEGSTLGASTWLIRLSGCDLRCWWCDSKQSSFREDEARDTDPRALEAAALASGAAWVSFTGGEPTWRGAAELKALASLCRRLRRRGMKVKVESNGRRMPKEIAGLVDLWSLSPKWDGRRGAEAARTAAMDYDEKALADFVRSFAPRRLQLKFVVTYAPGSLQPRASDLERACAILEGLPAAARRTPVFFIPEAYASGDYQARCRALESAAAGLIQGRLAGFDLRVQPQWHRVLYGDQRGR